MPTGEEAGAAVPVPAPPLLPPGRARRRRFPASVTRLAASPLLRFRFPLPRRGFLTPLWHLLVLLPLRTRKAVAAAVPAAVAAAVGAASAREKHRRKQHEAAATAAAVLPVAMVAVVGGGTGEVRQAGAGVAKAVVRSRATVVSAVEAVPWGHLGVSTASTAAGSRNRPNRSGGRNHGRKIAPLSRLCVFVWVFVWVFVCVFSRIFVSQRSRTLVSDGKTSVSVGNTKRCVLMDGALSETVVCEGSSIDHTPQNQACVFFLPSVPCCVLCVLNQVSHLTCGWHTESRQSASGVGGSCVVRGRVPWWSDGSIRAARC